MTNETQKLCELFIENRDAFKNAFKWDSGLIHAVCACILAMEGVRADEERLLFCKELIKKKFGAFSSFKGNARTFVAAIISTVPDPDLALTRAAEVFKMLRSKKLSSSDYLTVASVFVAVEAEPYDYPRITNRTFELYRKIKDIHPFLTSYEDTAFSAILALSERTDAELISDMEECYRLLKPNFMSSNPVQSLSHLLSLWETSPADKCARVISLLDAFKSARRHYDSDYGLPTAGALAMAGGAPHEVVENVLSVDSWLSHQPGFGFWSSITKQNRLVFAGMLSENDYIHEKRMKLAVISSALSIIIAQQQASSAAAAAT